MLFRVTTALVLFALPAIAEPEILHTSDNFAVVCTDDAACGAAKGARFTKLGEKLATQMESGVSWLQDLGFPDADDSSLETISNDSGTRVLRLQVDEQGQEPACGGAIACLRNEEFRSTSMILPLNEADSIENDSITLMHEFTHALQPVTDPQKLLWINEAVAETVGRGYAEANGVPPTAYPPYYNSTLDQPFYDIADAGYGNWLYLYAVGRQIGSEGNVAYLANTKILAASLNQDLDTGDAASGMKLFYDSDIVQGATFDKVFPEYVARFNNIDEGAYEESTYHYYDKIQFETFTIPTTVEETSTELSGKVMTYAAAPILVKLDVTPETGVEPKDTLMMVTIKFPDDADYAADTESGLSLVVEHDVSDLPGIQMAMIDGSNAPDELGFLRVVNAPRQYAGKSESAIFVMELVAKPVSLAPQSCASVGQPFELTPEGFSQSDAKNWTLKTDNGTVDGLTVTPSHAGPMKLTLEIESLVTRPDEGISRATPEKTVVDLGSFDVMPSGCMVRMHAGDAVITYTYVGEYTEFRAPSGEAVYFNATNLAAWDGQWQDIPAQMKGMVLGRMKQNTAALRFEFPDAHDEEGDFAHQMPYIFAQRFSWPRIKHIPGDDGKPLRRKPASCPAGYGRDCTKVTFVAEGHSVPILYDAIGRPVTVGFGSVVARFEYGDFDIRRPPGW